MASAHYAIEGCEDKRISVLFYLNTPVTGKSYMCCCGRQAIIRKYTLWGWWAVCMEEGCIMHKRYMTIEYATRRARIHNAQHPGKVHIYEGTKYQMFTPLQLISDPMLGD